METEPARIDLPCPSCRKIVSTTLPPSPDLSCPRCQCSLHRLAGIRADAAQFLQYGRAALALGDHTRALDAATAAWNLRHTPAAAALAFIAATLLGDTLNGISWLRAFRSRSVD